MDLNKDRLNNAEPFELPNLEFLELTILVEKKAEEGYLGDAGVSYLFRTNLGSLLFDVGFGPERPALAHNAAKLGVNQRLIRTGERKYLPDVGPYRVYSSSVLHRLYLRMNRGVVAHKLQIFNPNIQK